MRILSTQFLSALKSGHLFPLIDRVRFDSDLDLNIREGYLNIYYKGQSILNLDSFYLVTIDKEFKQNRNLPHHLASQTDVSSYISNLPHLKENIINYKARVKSSLEIEYEQLLIRSNNVHLSVNTDVFITDRQYTDSVANSRFDLTGILWPSSIRKGKASLPLVFVEVKYSLNSDIKDIDIQLNKYYTAAKSKIQDIAVETEYILKTKIELGLFNQASNRLKALSGKNVSANIDDALFIIALVDYNPNSTHWKAAIPKLKQLPFINQIKIFNCGFGIWNDPDRLILI